MKEIFDTYSSHKNWGGGGICYKIRPRYLGSAIAILLLFGFSTALFAGGGSPGEGIAYKLTGKKFRCFSKIGYAVSGNDSKDWITGNYCLPSPDGKNCTKQWDWYLDYKNDTVVYNNCSIGCRHEKDNDALGTGSSKPFQTYNHCAYIDDWYKVAKCVDKQTGEAVSQNTCESDSNGTRYYFKPNCPSDDTKEQCEARLRSMNPQFGWRFCYTYSDPAPPSQMYQITPGQTVTFAEYSNFNGSATFPCDQSSVSPSGGIGGEKPNPTPILGNLIIKDSWDSDRTPTSKVHTKISGNGANTSFALYIDENGTLKNASNGTCEIVKKGATRGRTLKGRSKLVNFKAMRIGGFVVPAGSDSFAESGEYTITCKGIDENGNELSGETEFFAAPYQYQFDAVNATFSASSGESVAENLLSSQNTQSSITLTAVTDINSKKSQVTHYNNSWTKKPVVKINEPLGVSVGSIRAFNTMGIVDFGVNYDDGFSGQIGVENVKSTTKAISDSSKMPPATTTASGTCNAQAITQIGADAQMNLGIAQNSASMLNITAENALVATMEVEIYDKLLQAKIESELANGNCKQSNNINSNGVCPFPPRLKLTFDYQIAPLDFKVELLDSEGNELKVLYYGQGTTPKVEVGNRLSLTAIGTDNKNPTKTFSKDCAAQDMQVSINAQLNNGVKVELVNKDNPNQKYDIIKASEFKDGKATISEAILKVTMGDDFTPAMKAEPAFINKGELKSKTQFFGFDAYPATYYPSYNESIINKDTDMVVLRARINAIDTDNSNLNSKIPDNTKVWYEFKCEYCNIDKVAEITGWNNGKGYTNADRSPTQQGWWIDRTFGKYNQNTIKTHYPRIESNNSNALINTVTNINNGLQEISYKALSLGTHKVNILHGEYEENGQVISMPNFLLYNAYWQNSIYYNTSSYIYINSKANDDNRDYGIDSGGAKNTRSGGRTGKF